MVIMKELKKQLCIRTDEILLLLGMEMAVFCFGELVIAAAFAWPGNTPETLLEIGTIMSLMIPLFMIAYAGIGSFGVCFNMGVGMGSTRKHLVPMFCIVTYLECIAGLCLSSLLQRLESWIFLSAYPRIEKEFDMGVVFQWKYIIVASAAITAVNVFFGALFIKYGRLAFAILWGLWILATGIASRAAKIADFIKNEKQWRFFNQILRALSEMPQQAALVAVVLVSLILALASWFLLRRQPVEL